MSTLKSSPRPARRVSDSNPTGHDPDELVIRLPDPRVLRLVARSVLLAAALFSLPWLRAGLIRSAADPVASPTGSRWIDDPFSLPMLLRDLRRQGLLKPGDRAIFLGDPTSRLPVLRRHEVDPVPESQKAGIPDRAVDFVLAADGFGDESFAFVDRVLRIGGVTAIRLDSDASKSFHLPGNYRMTYIRRFGSTVVAIKKIAHGSDADASPKSRRLLTLSAAKKAAIDGLEGALLEPLSEAKKPLYLYLPELMAESLENYPRRVFIDGTESVDWFQQQYPKHGQEFEIIKVESLSTGAVGIAEWLESNVREEEFVVVKAEVSLAAEVLSGGAARLVDELFLECGNRWAYWECLAVYGRLVDEGVAVHQWWG